MKHSRILLLAASLALGACTSSWQLSKEEVESTTSPNAVRLQDDVIEFIAQHAKTDRQKFALERMAAAEQIIVASEGMLDKPEAVSENIVLRLDCLRHLGEYSNSEVRELHTKIISMTFDGIDKMIARKRYYSSLKGIVRTHDATDEACSK